MGLGFGEEEVDVGGHDYVGEDVEGVADAGFFEDGEESVARLWCVEEWAFTEAVDVDGVEMA